jgi:hypothetical protein
MPGEACSPAVDPNSQPNPQPSPAAEDAAAGAVLTPIFTSFSDPEFPAIVSGILNNLSLALFGATFPILSHWLTRVWSGIANED